LVARKLLAMCGAVLVFRAVQGGGQWGDGLGPGSVACVGQSKAAGGSVYSYGGTGQHPLLVSHIRPVATPKATSVLVDGATTTSLTRNWSASWLLWRELEVRRVIKALTVQAATDAAAFDESQLYNPDLAGGSLQVLANVGQEVEDQVTLTVATAPIAAQVYTVDGLTVQFDVRDGRLLQTLALVGTN
jgi:hypothetical protein